MMVEFSDERFGAAVRERREHLNMKRPEFAAKAKAAGLANFHTTTVSRIESGEQSVRLHEALVIADLLGTDLYELLSPDDGLGGYLAVQLESDTREAIEAVRNVFRSEFNLQCAVGDDAIRISERMELLAVQGVVSDHQEQDPERTVGEAAAGLRSLAAAIERYEDGSDDDASAEA